MRPRPLGLVEVLAPSGDRSAGLRQRLEPVLVQALASELAVETLDVAVLHGAAGFNEDVPDAPSLRPGHEGATGELRAVVGAHDLRITAKSFRLVQQARDVIARDPEVDQLASTKAGAMLWS